MKLVKGTHSTLKRGAAALTGVVLTAGSMAANAAPPDVSALTAVFADAETVAQTVFTAALPVIGGVMILLTAIKIGKRIFSKI